jgi:Ca-activated chloride channel family protein
MPKQASIRDQLEADAWRNHPGFARSRARANEPLKENATSRFEAGRRKAVYMPDRRQRRLSWQDRALLILASILMLLLVVRVETARASVDQETFWGLELMHGGQAQRMVALDTDIEVDVTGLLARIQVRQVFQNSGTAWAEAVYRYPLPEGAAVDRMRIEVGGRIIEGEIQEKSEARRRYQQARTDGRVASLVEQQRANQFETRLANIGPGERIEISIGLQARVNYRDGEYSLRLPMTFTPRWDAGEAWVSNEYAAGDASPAALAPPHNMAPVDADAPAPLILPLATAAPSIPAPLDDHYLSVDIRLRTGLDLSRLESRYHDIDIHPALDGYQLFLADPDTRTDRVFELVWAPGFGSTPESTLATWDGGDAVYALMMLAPPVPEAIAPQAREVVFIIDTSGSMEGASMRQARSALRQGLEFLGEDDRFNLIRFDSDSELLFEESAPVYPAYLTEAEDFIEDLDANGGTVMAPALAMAMGLPQQDGFLRQIVFITDGSVGNEHELLLQVGEQLRDSRLFTVSIGSAPNEWFMRKAAEIGRGSHTQIGRQEEVEQRMASLWSRIENPAIQNICVDWGMDAEFYPEIIPDLYSGEPLWLYARLPAEPREVIICGDYQGSYWETRSRPMASPGSEDLAALWARSKIQALEDSRIFGTDAGEVRRQVLDLALDFGLLTRYTSLVAVDRTPSRPQSTGLEAEDVPSLLPAGSALASGFSQTATGWQLQLALSLFSLLVAGAMLLYLPPSKPPHGAGVRSPMTSSTT